MKVSTPIFVLFLSCALSMLPAVKAQTHGHGTTQNLGDNYHCEVGQSLCTMCQGDCDVDEDCEGNLVCEQRDTGSPSPEPCIGEPYSYYDYCVCPQSSIHDRWDYCLKDGHGTTQNLGDNYHCEVGQSLCTMCQGDCDVDSDCEGELICEQRDEGSPSPEPCIGAPYSYYDYCVCPQSAIHDRWDYCLAASGNAGGDPHFKTWVGKKYDFHGVCDLVLLQNPEYLDGLGMDIHIRTKQLKQFSYIGSAVLRIGDETLEVKGDINKSLFWINKQEGSIVDDSDIVGTISGYPISYKKSNAKQYEYVVDLNGPSIVMKTFKSMVHVSVVDAKHTTFGSSHGLLGAYGSGELASRDNKRTFEDTNEFGQEWQVLPSEGMLFHNIEGPQAPEKCVVPHASNIRRRLLESDVSQEEARISCASVDPDVFEMCVFDVMATGDKDVVGAY